MEILSIILLVAFVTFACYAKKVGLSDGLYLLHKKAYKKYQKEVLREGKLYEIYVIEFCSGNFIIHDGRSEITAGQLNERNKNYNIIITLLQTRSDLVAKYFIQEHFSYEDFLRLNKEFNTTTSPLIEEKIVDDGAVSSAMELVSSNALVLDKATMLLAPESRLQPMEEKVKLKKIVGSPNPFNSSFSDKEIEILASCINEAHIFTTTISPTILKSFFICSLDGALKSNNNSLLVYLMMNLNRLDYITNNWQSVIASKQLIYKKTKDNYLTKTDLSTPTEKVQCILPRGYEIIDKYIKELEKA